MPRHPLDLRKTPEELAAEGIVDPGPYPLDSTDEELDVWLKAHAKTLKKVTQEYLDASYAYVSSSEG
jgi:hypothetical protein